MPIGKKAAAEFIGTFWLVFGGCGSAVLAAAFPGLGIGFVGVALAFGLTVLTMAFAIGHISGCHSNPAVSVGLWVGKRFPASELLPYVIAQVLGGIAGAGVLYVIASGKAGFDVTKGFASNGYDVHSPGGNRPHLHVPDDYPRRHRQARPTGLCTHRDRPGIDADPPDRNSC